MPADAAGLVRAAKDRGVPLELHTIPQAAVRDIYERSLVLTPSRRACCGACDNGRHACSDAPIKVFAKCKPSQDRRKHTFGIEQERGIRSRHGPKAKHQKYRGENSSRRDRTREQWPFHAAELCNVGCSYQ
jgi:hypothetical protein